MLTEWTAAWIDDRVLGSPFSDETLAAIRSYAGPEPPERLRPTRELALVIANMAVVFPWILLAVVAGASSSGLGLGSVESAVVRLFGAGLVWLFAVHRDPPGALLRGFRGDRSDPPRPPRALPPGSPALQILGSRLPRADHPRPRRRSGNLTAQMPLSASAR
jgi:hypothetical protein